MSLTINNLKVYAPAKDFEASKRFYLALGFTLTEAFNGTFDCKLGNAEFRLQNYYVAAWANNFMMLLEVDDAREWYEHARSVIAEGGFQARVMEPETYGDTTLCHVIDPSGILLIFID